jgi:indoleacetate--lysine synthetase
MTEPTITAAAATSAALTPSVRMTHSRYDAAKVQAVVDRWWASSAPARGEGGPAPRVDTYEDFVRLVPRMQSADYVALTEAVYREHAATPYYVGGSSGTTSKSKLVLTYTPVPGSAPTEDQRELIGQLRRGGVFQAGDVVANCFLVGLFSILHHGMNRILDACCATVVPLGTLDETAAASQLAFLAQCGTNVLVGTPGTLVQIAHAVQRTGIRLAIARIAFTGERLGKAKLQLLRSVFPGVRVISLYGISECGFIAVGDEESGDLRVRENAYLVETDPDGVVLLSVLDPSNPVPVLRYAPGDRVTLEAGADGAWIRQVERSNLDFNFMGNLVELRSIRAAVAQGTGSADPLIDIVLHTGDDGRDELTVRVYGMADGELDQARRLVAALPELREADEKNAGRVVVAGAALAQLELSGRQKQRQILDHRA